MITQKEESSILGRGNSNRRGGNQSNISLIVAGQVSVASTRVRIEAIMEKTVSIFPFLLAVGIWPLLHFRKRKSLDSRDHTLLSDGKTGF